MQHSASSSGRTCSMGVSVSHSVITPPNDSWISPFCFSNSPSLRNLYLVNLSTSSLVAPSYLNKKAILRRYPDSWCKRRNFRIQEPQSNNIREKIKAVTFSVQLTSHAIFEIIIIQMYINPKVGTLLIYFQFISVMVVNNVDIKYLFSWNSAQVGLEQKIRTYNIKFKFPTVLSTYTFVLHFEKKRKIGSNPDSNRCNIIP